MNSEDDAAEDADDTDGGDNDSKCWCYAAVDDGAACLQSFFFSIRDCSLYCLAAYSSFWLPLHNHCTVSPFSSQQTKYEISKYSENFGWSNIEAKHLSQVQGQLEGRGAKHWSFFLSHFFSKLTG